MAFDMQAMRAQLQTFSSSKHTPRFVLFKGDWCGDCVRGVPPTKAVIVAAGLSLVEVDVGDSETWRDPNHPLRVDQQLKLTGIPTLIEWTENGPAVKRLGPELESASTAAEVERLVTAFVVEAQLRAAKG
ncbi:hypothetical protein Ndes2437B_g06800 [Nannochloris sp. 'desiccata']